MTVDFRLCNVLLSDGARSEDFPEMYIRRGTAGFGGDTQTAFTGASRVRYDFATYFNSFSNVKWRRFTCLDNAWLHIEAKGSYEVVYTGYTATDKHPVRTVLHTVSRDDADFAAFDYEYSDPDYVLYSFEILASESFEMKEAYYFTKVDEDAIRDVELAVATTTFRKEDFVLPNIELYKREILGCDEPIATHFTLHVVDNGRTLDHEGITEGRIQVHPNPNVGGAGGFARGMLESLEQEPKATHVILMDDDVQICPESLKRTFNLFSLVKDEYKGAFVSGAMLCLEKPDEFHEDIGYVNPIGIYGPMKTPKPPKWTIDVSELDDMVMLEAKRPRFNNQYAAWWYCGIPTATLEEKGLALPIFIRGDDAEYGNRAADGIITMNGICIWHLTSTGVFRAALERYYPMRNSFIAQAASGIYQDVDFLHFLHFHFGIDIKTFNYDAAELCIMGFEDFLKGPEYLKHLQTDEMNSRISKKNEQLHSIDEIMSEYSFTLEYNTNGLYFPQPRNLRARLWDFVTCNGQRGPKWLARGGAAVIPFDGFYYPPNEIRGKDTILAITRDGTKGVVRKKDRARAQQLLRRYAAARKDYDKRKDEIVAQWRAAQPELTSVEFWKWYLQDQAKDLDLGL